MKRRGDGRPDYYAVLGVAPGASASEIRKAYRRLAKKHHPDRKGRARSEEFLRIREAYGVLSNPLRRASYDRYGDPDIDEEFIQRLRRRGGGEHPFTRFAMARHRRMVEKMGCPRCRLRERCDAWRRPLGRFRCPKKSPSGSGLDRRQA